VSRARALCEKLLACASPLLLYAGGDRPAHRAAPGELPADDPVPPGWEAHPVGLEELALAYLREPGAGALPGPARGRHAEPSEVTQ
jgi:hypothetical protein